MDEVSLVASIFASMEYGPVLEGSSLAKAWLNRKSRKLASYINGEFASNENKSDGYEIKDKDSSDLLAFVVDASQVEIERAVQSSSIALGHWKGLTSYARARHLYNIARHLQQHVSLLAQMEALIRGVQVRDPRECDVPGMIRMFYHHAGWAQTAESEFVGWKAIGIVLGITSFTTPLQALSWLVAPALASGCTVILKPSRHSAPIALLLADLCSEAGLPAGVLNVITGTSEVAHQLATKKSIRKVTFFGSTQTGRLVRQETSGLGKSVTLLMSSRTPMIVLESADLDSACEAVVESAWFNQGQVPWAVTDVLVQQSVFQIFSEKLDKCVRKLRVGVSFDKMADVGHPCHIETAKAVQNMVDQKKKEGAKVLSISEDTLPSECKYVVPTVVIGGAAPDLCAIKDDDWPLPVVMLNPFRTAKEAALLANNSRYSLAAAIWTQDFSLAEEISQQLKVGTVWINCVNKFDAGVPFGASRQSGFGRIGGKEGMFEYLVPKEVLEGSDWSMRVFEFKPSDQKSPLPEKDDSQPKIDRTYKLYYGGAHRRPDGNSSVVVIDYQGKPCAMVADGSRKDIRNAVEAAQKAQPAWKNCGAHLRAQILFYMAENLELRIKEFSKELSRLTGVSEKGALEELNQCVECLFYWASVCEKNPVAPCQPPPLPESKVTVSVYHEPLGVIGIICPHSASPLLTPLSILAPAIAFGNAVIMVPNQYCPLPALWLCQVADTSDLPAGVVNIITGNMESLCATLANHHDVNALWCMDLEANSQVLETCASWSMKPMWWWQSKIIYGWKRSRASYHVDFFLNSTCSKAVWKPVGGMFGN